jgi:hypothetical protein
MVIKAIDRAEFVHRLSLDSEPKETVSPKWLGGKPRIMNSALYQEFLAEREEILQHKWLESEKVGYDVGFERALLDWIMKYRSSWRKHRRQGGSPAYGIQRSRGSVGMAGRTQHQSSLPRGDHGH